jgi:hypothetical protein
MARGVLKLSRGVPLVQELDLECKQVLGSKERGDESQSIFLIPTPRSKGLDVDQGQIGILGDGRIPTTIESDARENRKQDKTTRRDEDSNVKTR